MKRKLALLAVPLVVLAIAFGLKWRTEQPKTQTKNDLAIRSSIAKSATMTVRYKSKKGGTYDISETKVSNRDLEPFVKSVFLFIPSDGKFPNGSFDFNTVIVEFYFAKPQYGIVGSITEIDVKRKLARFRSFNPQVDGAEIEELHPITAKRWLELLLANPRIGPELRARMK